ncbi:MAG: hypothetical protein GWN01_02575 [Nitrosopumilaceae archaeon]|nr:hypothetical protein [Nitrosopumilaceae archaeon]NIT99852.1 hypothetical protein [Nitrosopumilaceae archaeon]NIU86215.1 hypothetical protein [Nitrosopumilaceae archaeon]NIX60455.1 hypothetical protein [Nitrosopumilaceae archaeon]
MKVTLCGSARFEEEFKDFNRRLSLAGHIVYTLAVYPSEMGRKDWYTPEQKKVLDEVHLKKIENSEAIFVIAPGGYIGESTKKEIEFAKSKDKKLFSPYPFGDGFKRSCPFEGCGDPLSTEPCPLCYE